MGVIPYQNTNSSGKSIRALPEHSIHLLKLAFPRFTSASSHINKTAPASTAITLWLARNLYSLTHLNVSFLQ
jgi:hypothetical protein